MRKIKLLLLSFLLLLPRLIQAETVFGQCNQPYISIGTHVIDELNYYFPPNTQGITREFYVSSNEALVSLSFYFDDILKGQISFTDLVDPTALQSCSFDASGLSPNECIRGPVKLVLNENMPAQIIPMSQLQDMGELDQAFNFIGAPDNIISQRGLKVEITLPENVCNLKVKMNMVGFVHTVPQTPQGHNTLTVDQILTCPDNDDCTGDIGSLSIISHECKPHLQACFGDPIWETPNGEISEDDLLELTQPGVYNVTGQYSNSCDVSATLELAEDFFVMPELAVEKNGPGSNACYPQDNQLTLKSNSPNIPIEGLETTWTHSNGTSSQGNPTSTSAPGNHTAEIIYNGFCLQETTNVDCNPYTEIAAIEKPSSLCEGGKELSICPEAKDIRWKKPNQLGDIQAETIVANAPGTYTVTAVDSFNCELEGSYQEDGVFLQEIEDNALYLPNAFSPNGDGTNDVFAAYSVTGSKITILDFKVFSRWGELIYERKNFQVNDSNAVWDGSFKGEAVQQAVYTYHVTYKLPECEEKTLNGDVTLLR